MQIGGDYFAFFMEDTSMTPSISATHAPFKSIPNVDIDFFFQASQYYFIIAMRYCLQEAFFQLAEFTDLDDEIHGVAGVPP